MHLKGPPSRCISHDTHPGHPLSFFNRLPNRDFLRLVLVGFFIFQTIVTVPWHGVTVSCCGHSLNIEAITAAVGKVKKVWPAVNFTGCLITFTVTVAREVCKVLIRARIHTWAVKRFKLAVRNTGDRRTNALLSCTGDISFSFFSPFHFFPPSSSPFLHPFILYFRSLLFSFFYDRPCKFLISTSKSEVMISPYVYILSWKVREAWERSLSFSLSNELSADNFPSSTLWNF